MTLADLIARALRLAHIVATGEDPEDDQAHEAVETFNDMLEAWRDDGIDLGLPTFTTADYDGGTVTVDVDAGATKALRYNLAVEAANEAGLEVSKVTNREAERSRGALAARLSPTKRVRFDHALTRDRRFNIDNC